MRLVKILPWRYQNATGQGSLTQDRVCFEERLGLMTNRGPFQPKTFCGSMQEAHLNQNWEWNQEQEPSEAQNGFRTASETTHRNHSSSSPPHNTVEDPKLAQTSTQNPRDTNGNLMPPLHAPLWESLSELLLSGHSTSQPTDSVTYRLGIQMILRKEGK